MSIPLPLLLIGGGGGGGGSRDLTLINNGILVAHIIQGWTWYLACTLPYYFYMTIIYYT